MPEVSEEFPTEEVSPAALEDSHRGETVCVPTLWENLHTPGKLQGTRSDAHRRAAVHLSSLRKTLPSSRKPEEPHASAHEGEAVPLSSVRIELRLFNTSQNTPGVSF